MNDDEDFKNKRSRKSALSNHPLYRHHQFEQLDQDEDMAEDFDQNKNNNVETTNTKVTNHNCANCICDVAQAIADMKRILIRKTDLLNKIRVYDCSKFRDIGDEIVITNSNLDSLPRHYSELDETKGRKYVDEDEIETVLRRNIEGEDREILTLPGFNLNIPCNHEGDEFMWTMSISRPNYTWIRSDHLPVSGYVQKNGVLELYDIDAKNAGNYSCIVSYIDPNNEEPVLNVYSHRIQVVTLPDYILRGGNRYDVDICDDTEVDEIATYLPQRLNDVLCQNEVCEVYVYTPHCRRQKAFINAIMVPANTAKLVPAGIKVCGIRCRKAIQDKVALLLTRNLRSVLQKPIVFRLAHHRETLVPIRKNSRKKRLRIKRGRSQKYKSRESAAGEVGLLIGCPAGYSLRDTHCLPCAVGYYSEDGSSYCKKCPIGSHQPNTGSRTCRACISPFVEGCHDMIWGSSSIIIIGVASVCSLIIISIIAILIAVCVKRKCRKKSRKLNDSTCMPQQSCDDEVIPLMQREKDDTSNDGDNMSDSDNNKQKIQHNVKQKLKKRSEDHKLERNFVLVDRNELKKSEKDGKKKQKRKIIGFQYVPVACLESYQSHRKKCGNYSLEVPNRNKPPVPLPDFDKQMYHL